jgi:signal transduction histidine kinase
MIFADKDRLHQVLTNLLSNAIKYSPQDKPVVINIKITEHNHLKLEVQDYGKGISEDDQKLIFQKFSQASGPKNPLIKGTGLGLAIAKAMIEEHEGEIGVQSEINQGSIFYFTIPKWIHNEKKKINNLNLDSNLIKEAA